MIFSVRRACRPLVAAVASLLWLVGCSTSDPVLNTTAGSLQLTVAGLPAQTAGRIHITGPSGFQQTLTRDETLSDLTPGRYTITVDEVETEAATYAPAGAPQVLEVAMGKAATSAIVYRLKPETGVLTVTVGGLPPGVSAAVTVTGPKHFTQVLTGNATLTGLASGTYVVTATEVRVNGEIYRAPHPTYTAQVTPNKPITAPMTYALATGTLTITIAGLPTSTAGTVAVSGPNGFLQSLTTTTTLTGLEVGTYGIASGSVAVDGLTYAPTPSAQTVNVHAGETLTRTVQYSVATGALTITISGLPSSTPAAVDVAGPGGFMRTLTATTTIPTLPLGIYTVTPHPVTSAGTTYTGTPSAQSVTLATAGATVLSTVTYAPTAPVTGTLTLRVLGLPSEVPATVAVTGPNGFAQALTSTTTLNGLAPGTYGVAAVAVTTPEGRYAPTPPTLTLTITAGATSTATVTYAMATGRLALTVLGLPADTDGSVTVAGPNGFLQALRGSTTLALLAPGSYAIVSAGVTTAGVGYQPTPLTQSITVTAGATAQGTVTYAVATGTLAVTITGLPDSVVGTIAVTGPNGFTQSLTTTGLLRTLAPGPYTITATPVLANGVTYDVTPAAQTVTVAAGEAAQATVRYAPSTGTAVITVTGLPVGVAAALQLRSPDGSTQPITTSSTLPGLTAGAYTLTATTVASGGTNFTPSPATQSVTITGGGTTTASVAYTASTGSLTLTLAGVPSGAHGSATVTGPNGFTQVVAATTTLIGLVPGTYTITTSAIVVNGVSFTPTPATQSVTVVAGETAPATVTYSGVTTSSLTVTVTGLPGTAHAAITVTGPSGATQPVYRTVTLSDLPAGAYTIAAASLVDGGFTYVPTPTSQVVTLVAGGASTRSVAYSTAAATSAVTVDVSARFQTMDGFGTTTRLFDDPHFTDTFDPNTRRSAVLIPAAAQDAMMRAAYADLGLTRVRYATDPGVEWTNDNADPTVVNPAGFSFGWKLLDGHAEYVAAARALGVTTWFGSPIALEPWMNRDDVPEYVEYVMQILRRWRALGQELPLWAIANEPDFAGARSPEFHRLAIRALGPLMAAEGMTTRFVLADASYPSGALPIAQAVLGDPVARQYVAAVGVHLYPGGGTPSLPSYANLDQLSALAQQYGKPLWMTEWSNPDYMRWAVTMHELIATYRVSAVDYMWAVFGQWESYQAGLMTMTYSGTTYTGFTKKPVYGVMRQFSRYVRPGMVRVAATAPAGVLATAYAGAGQLVIVLVNPSGTQEVRMSCAACGTFLGADRSSASEIGVPVPNGATFTLPAGSVTTLRFNTP